MAFVHARKSPVAGGAGRRPEVHRVEEDWARLLAGEELASSMYALRALARQGELGARSLLANAASIGSRYALIWALAQTDCPELLQGAPTSPARAALFLMRRRRHKARWQVKPDRQRCLDEMLEPCHPLRALAAAVRLLELYGQRAIPGLIDGIVHRGGNEAEWEVRADLCAWALGRLGRSIVGEVKDAFARASPAARRCLTMALWYLGPSAASAVPLLLREATPMADAALLAMEDRASLAVIAQGSGPVWLDERAVDELAQLAFHVDADWRVYAACALGGFPLEADGRGGASGFGPARARAIPLLLQLLEDPAEEVKICAGLGLIQRGPPEALARVGRMMSGNSRLEAALLKRSDLALSLIQVVQSSEGADRLWGAGWLRKVGLGGAPVDAIGDLLERVPTARLTVLKAVKEAGASMQGLIEPVLAPLLRTGDVASKVAVLECLTALRAEARFYAAAFDDPSPQVVATAVLGLGSRGLSHEIPLARLLRVRSLQPSVLQALVSVVSRPSVLQAPGSVSEVNPGLALELLPLLKHEFSDVRGNAAEVLNKLASPDPRVLDALELALNDWATRLPAARALMAGGRAAPAWILLGSSDAAERGKVAASLADSELPAELLQAIEDGGLDCSSLEILGLLRSKLSLERLSSLIVCSFQHFGRNLPGSWPKTPWQTPVFVVLLELVGDSAMRGDAIACLGAAPPGWLWMMRARLPLEDGPVELLLPLVRQLPGLERSLTDLRRLALHPDSRVALPSVQQWIRWLRQEGDTGATRESMLEITRSQAHPDVRRAALAVLATLRWDPDLASVARELANHADPSLRALAMGLLFRRGEELEGQVADILRWVAEEGAEGPSSGLLKPLAMPEYREQLERLVDSVEPRIGYLAFVVLRQLGMDIERQLELLSRHFPTLGPNERSAWRTELVALGKPAIWLLLDFLKSESPGLRSSASGCLEAMPAEWLWESHAALEAVEEAQQVLARALTTRPVQPEMLPVARKLAQHESYIVASRAIDCLGDLAAWDDLTVGLAHPDPIIRIQTLRWLEHHPSPVEEVRKLVGDREPMVRLQALVSLHRLVGLGPEERWVAAQTVRLCPPDDTVELRSILGAEGQPGSSSE